MHGLNLEFPKDIFQHGIPHHAGLIIDNFAGGGGASDAIRRATGRSPDAAINHDPEAVAMHEANHPETKHYCQNIYQVDPRDVVKDLGGGPVALAWFSPDCKHFSNAKGGVPVKRNVRDLAWVAVNWAEKTKPYLICLENVIEFTSWGKVCFKTNKPLKADAGKTFKKFVYKFRRLGYSVEWRELLACDYGAPTIRKRLFLIARCDGAPILWPQATHGPIGSGLIPYRTSVECIDWSYSCPSIFNRPRRPLALKTNIRMAKGLRKFVLEADNPFILGNKDKKQDDLATPFIGRICQNGSSSHRGRRIDTPLSTVTTKAEHLLVMPHLTRQFGNSIGHPANVPMGTITAGGGGKTAIVSAHLAQRHQKIKIDKAVNRPSDDVMAYLIKYYGTAIGADVNEPMHSVTTKDRFGLVQVSVDTDPSEILRYQAWWMARWLEDHDPEPESQYPNIPRPRRSAIEVKVSGQIYVVYEIGMRMLQARELFNAQGFDPDYKINIKYNGKKLSKKAQVRMCGNSVSPPPAEEIIRLNFNQPQQMAA